MLINKETCYGELITCRGCNEKVEIIHKIDSFDNCGEQIICSNFIIDPLEDCDEFAYQHVGADWDNWKMVSFTGMLKGNQS